MRVVDGVSVGNAWAAGQMVCVRHGPWLAQQVARSNTHSKGIII
jgi:hypothetical protein